MGVRSDYALDCQLEQVREQAASEEVKGNIDAALGHMRSRRGGHRKGGRALIQLLEAARQRAVDVDEWSVVRLLQDSLDYSEERILQPDFEERYRLYADGKRNESLREFVAANLEIHLEHVARKGREFLGEHPEAGVEELLRYLESLSVDARHLLAPLGQPAIPSFVAPPRK